MVLVNKGSEDADGIKRSCKTSGFYPWIKYFKLFQLIAFECFVFVKKLFMVCREREGFQKTVFQKIQTSSQLKN